MPGMPQKIILKFQEAEGVFGWENPLKTPPHQPHMERTPAMPWNCPPVDRWELPLLTTFSHQPGVVEKAVGSFE